MCNSLEAQNKSFYDFNVTTIDGKEFPLSSLKGKKVLVVKCSLQMRTDATVCQTARAI